MDKYKETYRTWNKVAKQYEDKFMEFGLYDDSYDFFLNLLGESSSVLEIGCGPGNITKYFLQKKPHLDILGIDVAPQMITRARLNNPTANFEVRSAQEILTLNQKFNAIIGGFCIPYMNQIDLSKMIADCSSLLINDGILYLSFVEGNEERSGYVGNKKNGRVYFFYHELEFITLSLESAHFEMIKLFHLKYLPNEKKQEIHTVVIARKITHD